MKVRVLYFASAADAAGRRREVIELDDGRTVKSLAEAICVKHPGMGLLAKSTRYAVNLEIADDDVSLRDGDEVGVLPAVTGG